eukprot:TRINITY_DN37992_c0_g1_i1.p1 TRINITY_DN37992_c0_g1~~TRINITY_DN37992_c0_g1_i1.p1  ORF type:complete len:676 (-),score=101.20 TRINITY_DN37992_c0_g1_i1:139-2166(-)
MLERGLVSRILFPAPRASYNVDSFPKELIWVPKRASTGEDCIDRHGEDVPKMDDESIPCLLLTYPSARFLIIFFHSNAEDLGRCRHFCCYLREQFQVHVLAVEYPGYGICPGVPSGETVMENALSALRFATNTLRWPLDSIKVFGRSIGTGPAVGLASLFSFAGVILVTPFLSVQELFRDRVGPFAGLVEEWFANMEGVSKITSPTMIIHGQRDELVSCRHGETLYELLKSRKLLVSPPEMEHNTNLLTNLQYFVLPMFQFFALPDYVFQEMNVPDWAYDKRRSPFYNAHSQGSLQTIRPLDEEVIEAEGWREASLQTARMSPSRPVDDAATAAQERYSELLAQSGVEVDDPEAQEALQRLEEFAGRLCRAEICSDRLCSVEDTADRINETELAEQEQELEKLVRERQQEAATRQRGGSRAAAGAPKMDPPRFFGQRQMEATHAGLLGTWCSNQKTTLGPEAAMRLQDGEFIAHGNIARPLATPMYPPGISGRIQACAAGNCEESVWLRWCGASDKNTPMIDLHEADAPDGVGISTPWAAVAAANGTGYQSPTRRPGQGPPLLAAPARPSDAEGLLPWSTGGLVSSYRGGLEARPGMHASRAVPFMTACCQAVPSDPLLTLNPRPPTRPPAPGSAIDEAGTSGLATSHLQRRGLAKGGGGIISAVRAPARVPMSI